MTIEQAIVKAYEAGWRHSEKCALKCTHKLMHDESSCPYSHECDCDGYHTFGELYDHRVALWIALCGIISSDCGHCSGNDNYSWRSKRHSDGELSFGGMWFVLGIGKEKGEQITYHLPIEKWDECEFAETLEKAPEFDGHTSDDVLERLKEI
jgi:hypothetical protein